MRIAEHDGQTCYFRGSKCKDKLDQNPTQYLGKPKEKLEDGRGCCD
jgi:YHS domain-containing protein